MIAGPVTLGMGESLGKTMTTKARTNWHLAQLKPNSSRIAERNLLRQGFVVFLPRIEETVRRGQKFVTEQRALFPGYAFVGLDPANPGWRSVNSTLGVSRLVSFGAAPVQVPDDLVLGLMARCDGDGLLQPEAGLRPGDTVVLTHGPFTDFVATIDRIAPDRRVWVLLDLMGQQVRVKTDTRHLAAV
jgi:transcriptional antiterminator RfaH